MLKPRNFDIQTDQQGWVSDCVTHPFRGHDGWRCAYLSYTEQRLSGAAANHAAGRLWRKPAVGGGMQMVVMHPSFFVLFDKRSQMIQPSMLRISACGASQ